MVNALARSPEYQGKVLWLEHDVDDNADTRKRQWWTAKRADDPAATSATTPLILVDGGRTYADGRAQPFEARYRELVDEALTEPPLVTIEAIQEPGAGPNRLLISGTITNLGEQTIGYANTATLWFMAFEEKHVIHVDWFVRRAVFKTLEDDLDPGQTMAFSQELQLPDGSDMEAAQVVVTLDHRPVDRGGAYWAANAALASKFAPIATPAIPPVETQAPPRWAAPARARLTPPRQARGVMDSGIRTATTSPRAQTSPSAVTHASTTTLRLPISFTRPRTSSSTPSGVGRR